MSNCSNCQDANVYSQNTEFNQKSQVKHARKPNNFATTSSCNSTINSLCNESVWGDEFMMSLAWNDEFFPELGASKSHLIPLELINFSPKDTLVKQIHPCNPNIIWERKGGYLYVRDTSIDGSPDLNYQEGGQIVMKLSSNIPANAIAEGYNANKLTGLVEAINNLLDGDTVFADPSNNNKITARVNASNLPSFLKQETVNKTLENLITINASSISQGYKFLMELPIKTNLTTGRYKMMINSLIELQIRRTNSNLDKFHYSLDLNSSHSLLNVKSTIPNITKKSGVKSIGFSIDYIETLTNTVIAEVDTKLNKLTLDFNVIVPTGTNVTDIVIKTAKLEALVIG